MLFSSKYFISTLRQPQDNGNNESINTIPSFTVFEGRILPKNCVINISNFKYLIRIGRIPVYLLY